MSKGTDNAVTRAAAHKAYEATKFRKNVSNLKAVFSTPEGAEALKFMREVAGVDKPVFGENSGYDPIKAAFADGARAFMLDIIAMKDLDLG